MKTINLKDYYPYYAQDTFVDVSDELFAIFEESAADRTHKLRFPAGAGYGEVG